jgi:hypothetical protein
MKQCFEAAGLAVSEKEAYSYAAITATEIIDEGLVPFAEGNSIPHGSGSNTVAGGSPVPGFLTFLRSVPEDAPARLDAFDEIFQRFVDLTATVEAGGESGALSNAAYNRAQNAADEILKAYFEERTEDAVQQLHKGFGDASTPPIDMSKVTLGKVTVGSGCAVVVLVVIVSAMVIALLIAMA